jgi:hypothetical protein
MASLIAVPLNTAADLASLAHAATLHAVPTDGELLVVDDGGQPIDLPAGARLALAVNLRIRREKAQTAPDPKVTARPTRTRGTR